MIMEEQVTCVQRHGARPPIDMRYMDVLSPICIHTTATLGSRNNYHIDFYQPKICHSLISGWNHSNQPNCNQPQLFLRNYQAKQNRQRAKESLSLLTIPEIKW